MLRISVATNKKYMKQPSRPFVFYTQPHTQPPPPPPPPHTHQIIASVSHFSGMLRDCYLHVSTDKTYKTGVLCILDMFSGYETEPKLLCVFCPLQCNINNFSQKDPYPRPHLWNLKIMTKCTQCQNRWLWELNFDKIFSSKTYVDTVKPHHSCASYWVQGRPVFQVL